MNPQPTICFYIFNKKIFNFFLILNKFKRGLEIYFLLDKLIGQNFPLIASIWFQIEPIKLTYIDIKINARIFYKSWVKSNYFNPRLVFDFGLGKVKKVVQGEEISHIRFEKASLLPTHLCYFYILKIKSDHQFSWWPIF